MQLSGRGVLFLSIALGLWSCGTFEPAPAADGGVGSGSASGSSGSSGTPAENAETIAAGLTIPHALVATSAGPYWLSVVNEGANTISRLHHCPPDGCKGAPALFLASEEISNLTADAGEILWTAGDMIFGCAVGSTCTRVDVYKGAVAGAFDAEAGRIFFTSSNAGKPILQACNRSACASSVTTIWTGDGSVGALALSGKDVWFTAGLPSTRLERSVDGAASTLIGELPGLPTSLAVTGTHVHFVSRNALNYCAATTVCSSVVVDPAIDTPLWIVRRTGDAVYYLAGANAGTPGKVMRCTNADCTNRQVVVNGGNPRDVAVYDGWLYWADEGNERPGGASIKRVKL